MIMNGTHFLVTVDTISDRSDSIWLVKRRCRLKSKNSERWDVQFPHTDLQTSELISFYLLTFMTVYTVLVPLPSLY